DAVDIVGTGGDQLGTVNISTMAAIVTAAAGYPVLKHGSRSASGRTGSSEFLEALGVKLDLSPERLTEVFEQTGIAFFFAPLFHPALKNVAPLRKELGVPTTFNFLGPLANPVQPIATALGVANQAILPVVAGELVNRGRTAIVFRGQDGLDELTTTGTSQLYIIKDKAVEEIEFSPESLGISLSRIDDLIGGDAEQNAKTAKALFAGNLGENPILDIVCLNAAAAMTAFDLAQTAGTFNFQETMSKSYRTAREVILEGKAALKLSQWVEETNK
ncbi:MAG: anthranilate phosphoribosyltransferase, partial [Microbacteriaceae bacterium]|nr:anthranilate phosphoribosyltransferase [Microbacteriaceae bacterium]